MEHIDDNTPVTNGEFSDHLKEFEKIDEMVFDHEDILSRLLAALSNEENLSPYTIDVVDRCFAVLHPDN